MGVFGKNRASSVFSVYGPLTSCKELKKTNEPILRKTPDRLTDWQTELKPTQKGGSNYQNIYDAVQGLGYISWQFFCKKSHFLYLSFKVTKPIPNV